MVVVDTSVWVDYFNGKYNRQTDLLDTIVETEALVVGDLILTEVLQGFNHKKDYDIAKMLLTKFECRDMVGQEVALEAAQNYHFLRKKGLTVRKTIDIIIGAFCIVNNFSLLHFDRDFNQMAKYLKLKCL